MPGVLLRVSEEVIHATDHTPYRVFRGYICICIYTYTRRYNHRGLSRGCIGFRVEGSGRMENQIDKWKMTRQLQFCTGLKFKVCRD